MEWTHVRIPRRLADRLERLARATEQAYREGRIELPGDQADRVALWFVVERAVKELESKRARSNRPRSRPTHPV